MSNWPKSWSAEAHGRHCPACGEKSGRPILWGMPSFEIFEALEAGEIDIAIGGCCVTDDDPRFECQACGHRFGGRPQSESDPESTQPKAEA